MTRHSPFKGVCTLWSLTYPLQYRDFFALKYTFWYTQFGWNAYQHMHIVWHNMHFYNLYSFVVTKLFQYISNTFFVLIIANFFLYLEINTMWYLHIHLVCAKQFALLAIKITFPFVINQLEEAYYNEKVIFCITNTALPHSGWLIFRTLHNFNRVTTHNLKTGELIPSFFFLKKMCRHHYCQQNHSYILDNIHILPTYKTQY